MRQSNIDNVRYTRGTFGTGIRNKTFTCMKYEWSSRIQSVGDQYTYTLRLRDRTRSPFQVLSLSGTRESTTIIKYGKYELSDKTTYILITEQV